MLIQGKIEYKRIPVNIIINKENLDSKLPYYCIRCRSYIFSINRDIAVIFMGEGYPAREIPDHMGWIEFYCHGCKRNYNFYLQ